MTFREHAACFFLAFTLLTFNTIHVQAQCGLRAPLRLQSLRIVQDSTPSHRTFVECIAIAVTDGDLIATLHPADRQIRLHDRDSIIQPNIHAGEAVLLSWTADLPGACSGRLGDVVVRFTPHNPMDAARFTEGTAYSLYAVIANGHLSYSGSRPTPIMIAPPRGISAWEGKHEHAQSVQSAPTTIHVNITGQVTAPDIRNVAHGVSNLRVYFDWDADEDAGTFQAPVYDLPGDTAQYAIADVNGNFSFTRQVTAENDSWVWNVHQIRIYATAWNDAGYIEDWGKNAVFADQRSIAIASTPTTPDINPANINWSVTNTQGMALRYLWRARQFAIEDFGLAPPPQIDCDIDPGDNAHFNPGIAGITSPSITFPGLTNSETAYHEYGHYVHHLWADVPGIGNCSPHNYPDITNDGCAIVEGWAEFCCAAAHMFWYAREQPDVREPDVHGEPRTQFLERLYSEVPANNGDCEGGVARFFFNLWDGIAFRSPGSPAFTGDNDDLYVGRYGDRNGGHPHQWLLYTLKDIFQYDRVVTIQGIKTVRRAPFIDVYRSRYLGWVDSWFPFTSFYHHGSIDAMYRRMTTLADEMRAATPTVLNVAGNEFQRTLNWNDVTEPASFNYAPEGASSSDPIVLASNNEPGFAIWRKTLAFVPRPLYSSTDPAILDGRLDAGFQLIALAGSDATTYTDHQWLGAGEHYYVVTAFHHLGDGRADMLSIPLAQASIRLRGVDIHDGGPGNPTNPIIRPAHHDDITAESATRVDPVYQWIASNKPGWITLSGANTKTLTITNNYQPGAGYQPSELQPFSVRCIVADASGADTSLPYYPAYTPLDSATAFVRVRGASGLVPDADLERGMDFATQPLGDVMSVHLLGTAPVRDSLGGYTIELEGVAHGGMAFNHARLLALPHPAGTRIGGTPWSGYHVEQLVGGVWVQDTTRPYGAEELPLTAAAHTRLGDVSAAIRDHDSLAAVLAGGDTITLRFSDPVWTGDTAGVADSLAIADSTETNWPREYLLELRGVYAPNAAIGARAAGTGANGGDALAENAFEMPAPNPGTGHVLLRYRLAREGLTRLEVLNGRGDIVRSLLSAVESAGEHEVRADLSGLPSGAYFCRLVSDAWSSVHAITLIR